MEVESKLKTWSVRALVFFCFLFLIHFWCLPTAEPQIAKGRKKVRFWHMWTAEWKDVVDRVVDKFNKSQTEYQVEALSIPAQTGADAKLVMSVIGKDPPDVMAEWDPVMPQWAEANLLTPLDELMSPEEKARFDAEAYPIVKKLGSYKGRLYSMSIGINMFALFYRPSLFKEAGFDPNKAPTTLEELDAMGRKLNRFDSGHNLIRIGWMPERLDAYAKIFGGGFYDEQTGKVTIDTPQNRRALRYLVSIRKELGYDQVVRFQSGLDVNSFSGGWPFLGGAYAMVRDGQWRVEQARKYAPQLDYLTAPVPPPKGGKPLSGWSNGNYMVIPRGCPEPRGAWEFVKFWSGLMHPEEAAQFYTWGGWMPLTPAVAAAPAYREYLKKYPQFKTFVDLMPSRNMAAPPPVAYGSFLNDEIANTEDAAERGTLTADQAIDRLNQRVQAEVARRKELGYKD